VSRFERYLTLWVALCIAAGIILGKAMPGLFHMIASAEVAQVNLPVAVLIWLMIAPMLIKIDFGELHRVKEHWRGIGVTLFVNWAVKPFSMTLLGWLFIGHLFRPVLAASLLARGGEAALRRLLALLQPVTLPGAPCDPGGALRIPGKANRGSTAGDPPARGAQPEWTRGGRKGHRRGGRCRPSLSPRWRRNGPWCARGPDLAQPFASGSR
jgi:hypothetical protein